MKHRQKNSEYKHFSRSEMQVNVLIITSQFEVQQAKIFACFILIKVHDNAIMT